MQKKKKLKFVLRCYGESWYIELKKVLSCNFRQYLNDYAMEEILEKLIGLPLEDACRFLERRYKHSQLGADELYKLLDLEDLQNHLWNLLTYNRRKKEITSIVMLEKPRQASHVIMI